MTDIFVSTLPPETQGSGEPDYHPDLTLSAPYSFYDAAGLVTQSGNMGAGVIQMIRIQGVRVFPERLDGAREYVALASGVPTRAPRPMIEGLPVGLTVAAFEEAVIPGLPAGTISYGGPQQGTQSHEGGDATIGFVIPGLYTLTIDAFPYQIASMDLLVTGEDGEDEDPQEYSA